LSTEEDRTRIAAPRDTHRQTETTDEEIDALVYELYGLT
jgi:hypothetical protein